MKYLLFAGYDYYASGGWRDFQGGYLTLDEAIAAGINSADDWMHIVDSETLTIVAQYLRLNTTTGTFITRDHERWEEPTI